MSDYINREDAVKAVKHLSRNYTGKGKREDHPHIDFIVDEIKYEVPSADVVPRWIPCEERLPENESTVLVTDNNGHIRHAFYDAECDWFGTYEERMYIRAIAWMPLPDPYVAERKDDE